MLNTIQKVSQQVLTSDIGKRIAYGAFWSMTGTALGKFLVLVAGIICARILGKEIFGEFGMVRSTVGIFIVLGSAGIGITATRFISLYRTTDQDHSYSIYRLSLLFALCSGIVLTVCLMPMAKTISEVVLHSPHLSAAIQIAALILFASILNATLNGVLTGLEDFKSIAINTFIGSSIESILMVLGAWYYGLHGAIIGFGLGIVAQYIANHIAIRKDFKKYGITSTSHIARKDYRLIYSYCIPATLSALTVAPAFFIIRAMVVRATGYGELAIFEAADQWKVIILFIPTAVSQIVLPILSSTTDGKKFSKALLANIALIGVVSVVVAVIISILSPYIMPLYGSSFDNQTPLMLLAASTVFSSIANVIEMAVCSKEKMWQNFALNLVWATILIACAQINISKGATGLALAVLVSYAIKCILFSLYLKYINQHENK
ncbi:oligosaccharide flippase family protein [Xylanibacter ruminicola]|uniref:oligosaccharide flippase family protein n=1 Tax=Xylanibacter ruminicola TaxID=839 RepID=UPI000490A19E|nr:oligosaccharide flippase family protein [Xylanibacter ruminicola]